jgi:hypothetical protein
MAVNMDQLTYETSNEQQVKNTLGMWKIEGEKYYHGGKLEWAQQIRLKNVKYPIINDFRTGLYLAVISDNHNLTTSQDQMYKDQFHISL